MGTTKPLSIQVPATWLAHPTIRGWISQGHKVEVLTCTPSPGIGGSDVHLILAPTAWRMREDMLDLYGDIAIKQAQEIIYGPVQNKAPAVRKKPKGKAKDGGVGEPSPTTTAGQATGGPGDHPSSHPSRPGGPVGETQ